MTDIHDLDAKGWESHDDIKIKEGVIQLQNKVENSLKRKLETVESDLGALLAGMIEIAGVIFKNTCGIGSNFKLAECDLKVLTQENIRRFFSHVLVVLGYHFGQIVPQDRKQMQAAFLSLLGEPGIVKEWSRKLTSCLDGEMQEYSPVKAGRLLWEEVCRLFEIQNGEENNTARIYYQTALVQDLIYIMESIENERWSTVS